MLAEKPWKWDYVLLLAAGLMFCLSAGTLSLFAFEALAPKFVKANQGFLRFIASTVSFHGGALVMVHFLLKAHGATWGELLGLDRPQWRRALRLGLAFGIIVVPLALLLNRVSYEALKWILQAEPEQQLVVSILEKNVRWYQRVCFGLGAIVLAPFVEEILFRGLLYRLIKQTGYPGLALWGSSLLFAAIHANLLTFAPLVGLAVVFVFLYERTGVLLAAIATHAVFNAANFYLLLYMPKLHRTFGLLCS